MADRSFVADRSRAAIDTAFPASPTLLHTRLCDGLMLIGHGTPDATRLRPLRDAVTAIWYGALGDGTQIVVIAFDYAIPIDPDTWPSALPLIVGRADTLTSYANGADLAVSAGTRDGAALRRVDIWWGGRQHLIALGTLMAVPIDMLWDAPRITVHRSTLRTVAVAAGQAIAQDGAAPVSRTQILPTGDGIAAFDETTAALRDLEERTRLGAIFKQALAGLFGRRAVGKGQGGGPGGAAPRERGPGVFENLVGWMRWHSPLSKSLIAQFGNRLGMVEKLLASGDIDSALRLALKLGKENAGKSRSLFPNRLPDIRARLDFSFGGGGYAMPILGGDSYHALRTRYAELAKKLERDGDFRRAAYVHSQLLEDHRTAVLTLEKGELYRDAARLALDAKLEPALAIRMFYKAGELDTALALARRTGCFDQLAETSRTGHPDFHAYVIRAWTDMLVATDQPLRALQVTDAIADVAAPDPELVAARRRWLGATLALEATHGFDSETIARALVTARWNGEDFAPHGLTDFPFMSAIAGTGAFPSVLQQVQDLVRLDAADARGKMLDLLHALTRFAKPEREEQAGFWGGPAAIIVEVFARSLLEAASDALTPRDMEALRGLLGMADLHVFATDLGKLAKLHVAVSLGYESWRLPPATSTASPIAHGCLLHNGTMVVWRENTLLQLLDPEGRSLWQDNVSDIVALVAVGSSPNVIIVQRPDDGASLLTRFASHRRSFHAIGRVDLVAHHDVTSEGQWMVQIGGEIGAIDLSGLCADVPGVEWLWSCALTDRLRAIAFFHDPAAPAWITRSAQRGRTGLLELWSLRHGGDLTTQLCNPAPGSMRAPYLAPRDWFWSAQHGNNRIEAADAPNTVMPSVAWSELVERQIAAVMADRHEVLPGFDTFQSVDFHRARVTFTAVDGSASATIQVQGAASKSARMTIEHDVEMQLTLIARGMTIGRSGNTGEAVDQSARVLLADPHGRLLRVDVAAKRVTIL
ncbi:hypothetical protein [Sphingomonas alpina]|uniref:Uncharacterized protein n=1 Tax=Sphingomonas alpina TaxID=653931 RepID=A0A7H0LFN0_9SPHN|nr:hypothetical protein [Sphingomonas alpina]QNQ08483.1 hypothetical protein H3Z74_17270 [Sphingomonas alpina]